MSSEDKFVVMDFCNFENELNAEYLSKNYSVANWHTYEAEKFEKKFYNNLARNISGVFMDKLVKEKNVCMPCDLVGCFSKYPQVAPEDKNKIIQFACMHVEQICRYKTVEVQYEKHTFNHGYITVVQKPNKELTNMFEFFDYPNIVKSVLLSIFLNLSPVKKETLIKSLGTSFPKHTSEITFYMLMNTLYITLSKFKGDENTEEYYEWGQRAFLEIPQTYLLNKLEEMNVVVPIRRLNKLKTLATANDKIYFPKLGTYSSILKPPFKPKSLLKPSTSY